MELDFSAAVAYALSCLKCGDLHLKDKQMEAIRTIYEGKINTARA